VDYLLRDEAFPRSVLYSVAAAEQCLHRIGPGDIPSGASGPHEQIAALRQDLVAAEPKVIIAAGLHEYLDGVQKRLESIHSAIQAAYIDYGPAEVAQTQVQTATA
jgi:uncharacterized alpha-E superfamily protein